VIPLKRHIPSITNEHGFVFPTVLLIITVIFILFFINVKIYQNEIVLTDHHLDFLNVETLHQIAIQKLKNDLRNNPEIRNTSYNFPNGKVNCTINKRGNKSFRIRLNIRTNNDVHFSTISNIKITNFSQKNEY